MVDERSGHVERGVADGNGGLERAAAGEDRQAREQALLVGVEELVAPADGVAKGLMACRLVARAAAQEIEALVEPLEHRLRRKELRPRRGELERER